MTFVAARPLGGGRMELRHRYLPQPGFVIITVVTPEAGGLEVVARLEARKGHRYLFEAMARLAPRYPALRLLVVGDGDMKDELERQAVAHGIGDRVRFAGYRRDIDRVLAVIDVAALTSLWEGLPRSLVQAALVSKPILTFDVEGVREIVRDGENGFVVPIGDVDALTGRLGEMLADRGRTEAMGRRHLADIESRWSASRMVNDIESIYDESLDDGLEAA
jgi:glycosyltransferase involved in cell wall biosynthesis